MKTLSTDEIVSGIRQKNNDVIRYLYRHYFPTVLNYIHKNSGSTGDAEDVFQETLVAIYHNLREKPDFEIKDFNAYLFGVSNFIWKKKLRDNSVIDEVSLDVEEHDVLLEDDEKLEIAANLELGIYQKHFLSLDKEFQDILSLYFARIPFSEIANCMGYSSETYARKRKHIAQQLLISKIRSDPDFYEL